MNMIKITIENDEIYEYIKFIIASCKWQNRDKSSNEANIGPIWPIIKIVLDFVPKNVPVKFENNLEKKLVDFVVVAAIPRDI